MAPGDKAITPALERCSYDFYRGFLRGLFDAAGSVEGSQLTGLRVRLAQSDLPRLEAVQRMLLRLGIVSASIATAAPPEARSCRMAAADGGLCHPGPA